LPERAARMVTEARPEHPPDTRRSALSASRLSVG
jgi:hypothetical protein